MTAEQTNYIKKAYDYAQKMHSSQKRESGQPYISHPIQVAQILVNLKMDYMSVAAGFLHDVVEDTSATLEDISNIFGTEMAVIIDGLTKISKIKYIAKSDLLAENHRKLLLAMANDVRVIVVKLADRLHNMRTLMYVSNEKQRRISSETLEIYAPLADRLGISTIKWELEDLSLRYLNPYQYHRIANLMHSKRREREEYIKNAIKEIQQSLSSLNILYNIYGRPKHIYSIYKKMCNKHKNFNELYDLLAIRIITNSVKDCYSILGAIHTKWHPLPGRFKDYIAMPKSNMYQSIHTTVLGPLGKPVEIQIRTEEMHYVAEYGIAAHWAYKKGFGKRPLKLKKEDYELNILREILEVKDESKNAKEFMKNVKKNIFSNRVYVFSPKGDVYELPNGSTPIDFAYYVHTEIGNHTVGSKINQKIVPLNTKLKNGDLIEILTSKNAVPRYDWLNIVFTSRARNKINHYFKRLSESNDIKDNDNHKKNDVISLSNINNMSLNNDKNDSRFLTKTFKNDINNSGVIVSGISNILIHFAKCCRPIPGDTIVGYVTRGRGVTIHNAFCPFVTNIDDSNKILSAHWNESINDFYDTNIIVYAYNRPYIISDILKIINSNSKHLKFIDGRASNNGIMKVFITISVHDLKNLKNLTKKLMDISDVYTVKRSENNIKNKE